MLTQAQKTRLGIFVLSTIGLLVAAVSVLAGRAVFRSQDQYYVYFKESVSGLEEGAAVKLNGVRVGRVQSLRILPRDVSKVEAEIGLLPNTPVKESTRAVIQTAGLTGLRYIELMGSTTGSDRLSPGSTIEADVSFLAEMTGKADDITDEMHQLLRNVVQLTSAENQGKITTIMDSFKQFADNSNRLVETSQTNLKTGVELLQKNTAGIAEVTQQINLMLEENRESLKKTVEMTRAALGPEGLQKTMAELDKTLASSRVLLDTLNLGMTQNLKELSRVLQSMDRTLVNLEQFTRAIKDQPSALLGGRRSGKN